MPSVYHCRIAGVPLPLRSFGRTGLRVSALSLGTMTFGREADRQASATMLDAFLDRGGNLVDTADRYGDGASEETLGDLLGARRDDVLLATKFRWPTSERPNDAGASRRHLLRALDASLRRLRTDWIDLYQIHAWDPATPLEVTISTLDDVVRQGKVRYVGASNFAGWQLAKALGVAVLHRWEPFCALQPQYSLLAREAELDLLPLCRHDGLAVLAWGPLGGGVLTGKYLDRPTPPPGTRAGDGHPSARLVEARIADERSTAIVREVQRVAADLGATPSQVALRWVLENPDVSTALIGARSPSQLHEVLGAADLDLPATALAALDAASEPRAGHPHDVQRAFGVPGTEVQRSLSPGAAAAPR